MKNVSLNKFLLFLSFGASVFACQKKSKMVDGLFNLELSNIQEVEAAYAIDRIVPLETHEDVLLGEFLVVKMQGDAVYIYDENARDAIHHFDSHGKYHGKAVEVGEGPGMVKSISDFVPSDTGLEVLVGMGDFSKIMVFDRNAELTREIELDYIGFSFEKLPDGKYALSGSYNLPFVEHRLTIFNAEGERVQEFLPNDYSNKMMPMGEKNFCKEEGKVFFHEVFNPIAYEIQEKTLEPKFQFEFGKYAVPSKFWEVDIMEGFEMINKNGFAAIYSYWENESTAFFEIYVQQGKEIDNHQVMWDKNRQSATKRIFSKSRESPFYRPIGLAGKQLVFISQAAYVLDVVSDLPLLKTEGINKDDNPVLLFSPLNQN